MKSILQYMGQSADVQAIERGLTGGMREQLITGLTSTARALLIATLTNNTGRSALIVTHNLFQAQKLVEDLQEAVGAERVMLYPANELMASEFSTASPELRSQRLDVLNALSRGETPIVVAPAASLRKLLPPKDVWRQYQVTLSVGTDVDEEQLKKALVYMGYHNVAMVAAPGEFSVRGEIIDIYPLSEEIPIRLDRFGDEIETIRTFNVDDQRSVGELTEVTIGPATELILTRASSMQAAFLLEEKLAESLKNIDNPDRKQLLVEQITSEVEALREGQPINYGFKYMSLYYEKCESLLDYFPENSFLVFDEMARIQETLDHLTEEEAEWLTSMYEDGQMVHDVAISHDVVRIVQQAKRQTLYTTLFSRTFPNTHPQQTISINAKQMPTFHSQLNLLKGELDRLRKGSYRVVLLASDAERMKRLQLLLSDYDVEADIVEHGTALQAGSFYIQQGTVQQGFELPMLKLAVVTESEIFVQKIKRPMKRQKLSNAERIKSYSELKVGDFVVHVNHGIGQYLGIETLLINGVHKDYIYIQYQGTDKLYVPIEQIDLVQKYVGSEGKEPKVYKLGGTDWKKVKTKVEASVKDIAEDLIKLYAEREASRGYAFSPDGEQQREFEDAFPYQETEDQLRSIREIKRDMEGERPMDRLLCGDVGYGKTEVAIRAAFKAIVEGKQVAFLVPTTILAQQHYETMRERFQDHNIEVGLLSRFRSRKEQNATIKGLNEGTVNIAVGTHRLLSKDIKFQDLGLLIIDEEQRFGVAHKEKIKQLRANVDVLTLTATPIPRTLHMSLVGVRDLSVIETPPENRFPVQTYVMEYNGSLVRDAIERELARDGQVFFLYNRVEDIDMKAREISALVPEARVTYAHGKMSENELEAVMLAFLAGEFDVLVSTTIIETGVDIPNVNTLIVHDADKMGLSQLYQLRGRVGRSNRVAYAYFTHRKDKVLTEVAEKRLQAIKEFTELGSGFKIAMRDLSIRGAGNLLGAEQHGFIDSVGFDLYSQMLQDAIEERRGGKRPVDVYQSDIDLELDAYIPERYISDGRLKIEMYKRFRAITSMADLHELQEEMQDRFGEYPDEVGYLFYLSELRVLAREHSVKSIKQLKQDVTVIISQETSAKIDGSKLVSAGNKYGRLIGFGQENGELKMVFHTKGTPQQKWLTALYEMMEKIKDCYR